MSNTFTKNEEMRPTGFPSTNNNTNQQHHLNLQQPLRHNQLDAMQQLQVLHQQHSPHDLADAALMMTLPVGVGGGGAPPVAAASAAKLKRMCRFPGCTKVIKSQGHCQRHGARAKRCRVEGCEKQAQGTHDGMCKRHWKVSRTTASLRTESTIFVFVLFCRYQFSYPLSTGSHRIDFQWLFFRRLSTFRTRPLPSQKLFNPWVNPHTIF